MLHLVELVNGITDTSTIALFEILQIIYNV